jgi:hypothetical protein
MGEGNITRGTWTGWELRELYKDLDVVSDIGMDQGRTVKRIFESKLGGSRRRGRPRLRWLENVEKDLWEMKVKRW